MTQIECASEILFDTRDLTVQAREIGETILHISQLVIEFAAIKRVPRFCENYKENDVEHSFMLGLAGVEISERYFPGYDSGLVAQLALVHDLPELKTGDVATFNLTEAELKHKHEAEHAQLPQLLDELPTHIADLVSLYEEQKLPESRLVSHLDKLLPNAVNVTGAGLAVMKEDYEVVTVDEYLYKNSKNEARFRERFPEPHHEVLHVAHEYVANKFSLQFDES